jgi:hypothetical protein
MGINREDSTRFLSVASLASSRSAILLSRDEFCNCGHESFRNHHYGLISPAKRGLVLGDGFLFGLGFIVFEHGLHTSFVPTLWKLILFLHLCFLLMRPRNATSGLPVTSYAVITNTLSGFGSRT